MEAFGSVVTVLDEGPIAFRKTKSEIAWLNRLLTTLEDCDGSLGAMAGLPRLVSSNQNQKGIQCLFT
jgi:hypothetical protein